ncbi:MAG TPA: sigma 54-interacting transcriptional regulator [Pyrinomonadaceae bacterium]|jgi:DNA-binding NtrC family response regulator
MRSKIVPRLLIIDDLFGRTHPDRRNEERANLCGQYLLEDVTGDEVGKGLSQKIKEPIAQAVFFRGQRPTCSSVGDTVENDLESTLRVIRSGWEKAGELRWSLVLLDLSFHEGRVTPQSNQRVRGMPDEQDSNDDPENYFGLKILEAIHDKIPDLPVVILSSKPREEVSRHFTRLGALGFLPREDERSPELLREYIWRHGLIADQTGEMAGHSKPLLLALRAARRAAANRQNVLIRGERGAGKELLARFIYNHGKKGGSAPFVIVNSSVLSPSLYASELFGIEKRVATDVEGREGLIMAANGGDLFFDEIGDMLPEAQSGILRVLEYRQVTPVGSKLSHSVDVRFLSATNMDIEGKAAAGSFRSDLLDRLREGGTVILPTLRERREDLPLLVEKFVREGERANHIAMKREIEPETLEKICAYEWPGNIRQLRSCILNAVNSHPDVEHLVPSHIQIPVNWSAPASSDTRAGEVTRSQAFVTERVPASGNDVNALIEFLENFSFEGLGPNQLTGRLPRIEGAYARLLTHYLVATLYATRQPTPDNPDGKVRIHPAIKLMMGDSALTATKAADIIKQVLGIRPEAIASLLEDPVLKEASEIALRLRPRRQNRKT